ncbi:D-alanyl-D-alanine carboxypeptidase/D-alanyl-D-alanine endopeptidase [Basilea psittacipulmonis]|uniref:D-alanyl-D-alanine carboxypeptidase n=1 Tax=Basilea psittacipulmonis DSM 24701 TaxID=1072685 RepID=A0A077DET7_9BURK|nr:D-alanyl-D-alanine carboxypeptidase/D-alanyl-D-alanine-endopeptidase [Basilea psittacipulmonis]AIL33229.1 hypothetical protein IX83_07920 [Basilea psittacipulmonis DSM 24701]
MKKLLTTIVLSLCGTFSQANSLLEHFPQATISVYAINLEKDKELISISPYSHLHGASTLKIITALHAARTFSPDYRFQTTAYASRKPRNGVLSTSLTVEFVGDPSLKTEQLQRLAKKIREAGIEKITGNLIINVNRYSGHDRAKAWNFSDRGICFAGGNSAAQVNYNCVTATLRPNKKIGELATFETKDEIVQVTNKVRIAPKDSYEKCELNYSNDIGLSFTLSGCLIPSKHPVYLNLAVPDGNLYTAHVLANALKNEGISFRSIKIQETPLPPNLLTIASIKGAKISTLIQQMLANSDNHIAEQLFRNIAYAQTKYSVNYTIATHIEKAFMDSLNLDTVKVDGSGLSYHNRTTAYDLVNVMKAINLEDSRIHLLHLFPTAKQGTLASHKAFQDYPDLIGKTGSIYGANCFVGQFKNKDGDTIIFAYLINNRLMKNKQELENFERDLLTQLNNVENQE